MTEGITVTTPATPAATTLTTTPETVTKPKKWDVDGRVGLEAGAIYNTSRNPLPVAGANVGVTAKYGGFQADADATIGTALQGKLEVGYKQKFDENWGMNYSVKASATRSNLYNDKFHYENSSVILDGKTKNHAINFGAQVGATYNTEKLEVEAGIEGGYRVYGPEVRIYDGITNNQITALPATREGYVSPYVSAKYNIANCGIGDFYIKGEANMNEASVGGGLTF